MTAPPVIRLHDSLSGETRPFLPAEPGVVTLYACGPTVYAPAHIGNFRTNVCWDVLRRTLELFGHRVRKVMNITDVGHLTRDDTADGGEDKMEVAARSEGVDPLAVAQRYIDRFHRDRRALRIRDAEAYPRATEHIGGMIALIERLVAKGHAYVVGGNVYFEVATFPAYGRLSRNTLENLVAGARVEPHPDKRHPADFALWKTDPDHLQQWDAPWGRGFPGWHIECSVMAAACLGVPTLDIHAGGEDHLFPHHECEIAQSEGAYGVPFARFWLHSRFMNVEGRKMSKSLGNFWTLDDVVERGHDPVAVRYLLLSTHYRAHVNFTEEAIEGAAKAVERIRGCLRNLRTHSDATLTDGTAARAGTIEAGFRAALADDLNVSAALAQVHEAVRWVNSRDTWEVSDADRIRALFGVFDDVLDVLTPVPAHAAGGGRGGAAGERGAVGGGGAGPGGTMGAGAAGGPVPDSVVEAKIAEREAARLARDFPRSDALRAEIAALGVVLEDTPRGPRWHRAP